MAGTTEPRIRHTARTIAALAGNPGCSRRAVLDAAGVDKQRVATQIGFPARFGRSSFAITRADAFRARLLADGNASLFRLLAELLGPGRVEVYDPRLRLTVGARVIDLESDLLTVRRAGLLHGVAIKSFPVIDGQADGAALAAVAGEAAVHLLALRETAGEGAAIAGEVVLVCPADFTNEPTAVLVDVRRQVTVRRRQLARLPAVDTIGLPADLDPAGGLRPPQAVAAALGEIPFQYVPECLGTCELAFFCRDRSGEHTAALGRSVRDDLGGIESVALALDLAAGAEPAAHQVEAARVLRLAARLRAEALAAR